jgi:hypothetical protein
MPSLLTEEDAGGTRYLRAGAIPVVVAAIAVPVVVAMLLSVLAIEATAIGMAAGAAAGATLLVLAGRLRPRGKLEVAARTDAERRLLVIAAHEVTSEAAERVARIAEGAADVRLVVPVSSRRIDRWLSAEDAARGEAQNRLAHSAGALVAAGLPVSGSLGDNDLAQALEDELRGYPADRVVLVGDSDSEVRLQPALDRLDVRYDRVG